MADLRSDFVGIKSPNPFWLASAPPMVVKLPPAMTSPTDAPRDARWRGRFIARLAARGCATPAPFDRASGLSPAIRERPGRGAEPR